MAEKRLIDAKAYCMELYDEMNYPGRTEEFMAAIEVAIADLADAPTVDAMEVRHGRWIYKETCGLNTKKFHCSVCNKIPKSLYPETYCPNCGAKMADYKARKQEIE